VGSGILGPSTAAIMEVFRHHGHPHFHFRPAYLNVAEHLVLMLSSLPTPLCRDLIAPFLSDSFIPGRPEDFHQDHIESLERVASTPPPESEDTACREAPRLAAAWILSFWTGCVCWLRVRKRSLVISRYWTAPRRWFSNATLTALCSGQKVVVPWTD
jgi:hypothetical protein